VRPSFYVLHCEECTISDLLKVVSAGFGFLVLSTSQLLSVLQHRAKMSSPSVLYIFLPGSQTFLLSFRSGLEQQFYGLSEGLSNNSFGH